MNLAFAGTFLRVKFPSRSDIDPTETADRIRTLMYAAGFGMLEQSDKGSNQPAYDTATRQYTMQWTFVLYTEEYPS